MKPFQQYQLFGLGGRRKFVYQGGVLRDALFGEVAFQWNVRNEKLEPSEYRAVLETDRGTVRLYEDVEGFWLQQYAEEPCSLSAGKTAIHLPDFAPHPRAALLRQLHAELLLNVMPWGPVPNLWVYSRPWYRDAAMMALCFERTGNVNLIVPWIRGLRFPFDYNNRGIAEADNPGQVLYLASLAGDEVKPLVDKALHEVKKFHRTGDGGLHIAGLSDFAAHPVYQTKWLKYGLRRLGLEDPYVIPTLPDSYSSLFWMDYRDQHVAHQRFGEKALAFYPYLSWAEAHFYNEPPPGQADHQIPGANACPLTREVEASEADYSRMAVVHPPWVGQRWSSPHTWHAAEMLLYFLDNPHR